MQISVSRPVSQVIKISEPAEQTVTVSKPVDRVVKVATGVPGPPTNIEIGDVETLPSGEEAYLRMRGTAPNLILDAGLVSGADGSGGGDSQIYMHAMDASDDLGEGWDGFLGFMRVGNLVTFWGQVWAAEGGASQIITDKIPMGYRSVTEPITTAFLLGESESGMTATPTIVAIFNDSLLFPLEESPAGAYYMATAVYVTLDDPPESDVFEP